MRDTERVGAIPCTCRHARLPGATWVWACVGYVGTVSPNFHALCNTCFASRLQGWGVPASEEKTRDSHAFSCRMGDLPVHNEVRAGACLHLSPHYHFNTRCAFSPPPPLNAP